ncbi:carboxypeptidase [Leptospira perolatii]|uniref:Carboxypeptidase n=1 Tax=Leptospira perolatii TaxID=2023191 RepID=A0A2M9ZT88_9LEPT|nr:M14 family zinc carboxypeptidase [Leptospira perolatii]PJZ71573.1 carboxypeptidase [Leptospira perolatii]PJZ75189.1 carboxypeptidase [Leptospira perolatii]
MLRGLKKLNRYEKRLLRIAKLGEKITKLKQVGFSRRTKEGFRFPIYSLEIGTEEGLKKNPVGITAGVHGLETIGIQILLDFLDYILHPKSTGYMTEFKKSKLGLVVLPMVNPGGVALKSRANPGGVDLMRNSGVEAVKALPFFGGHNFSSKLPYYRGHGLEPESRTVFRTVFDRFFHAKNAVIPILDVHSGFGTVDNVWWPYAYTKYPCPDTDLYLKIASYLKNQCGHIHFAYGPQSESYTTHGDLWDRIYDHYREVHSSEKNWSSKLLPITLEVGTWSDVKEEPMKIFSKKGIFRPAQSNKHETLTRYRGFLRDVVRLGLSEPKDWI